MINKKVAAFLLVISSIILLCLAVLIYFYFSKQGTYLRGYKIIGEINFRFNIPSGLAIDKAGNIYVSELYEGEGYNARILKFNKNGEYLGWLGKGNQTTGWHLPDSDEINIFGVSDGEFGSVNHIVFDQAGNLHAIDGAFWDISRQREGGSNRIQKFSPDGEFLGWLGKGQKTIGWHEPGSGETGQATDEEGGFHAPLGLQFKDGYMLVVEARNHRVSKFNSEGKLIEWFGKASDGTYGWHKFGSGLALSAPHYGNEVGAFHTPFDLKFLKDKMYIVSYNSDPVIAIFDYKTGKFLDGLYHGSGYKPQSLILDKHGNFIFSDNYQGSVRFFNKEKQEVAHIQLGPGGDYFGVGDFVFDQEGYLYFTEMIKNKVYKVNLIYD